MDPPPHLIARTTQLLHCPTLLLYGKESRSGNPDEDGRARFFPRARVVGVDRVGHWLHHDRLDEFLRVVENFLAG